MSSGLFKGSKSSAMDHCKLVMQSRVCVSGRSSKKEIVGRNLVHGFVMVFMWTCSSI